MVFSGTIVGETSCLALSADHHHVTTGDIVFEINKRIDQRNRFSYEGKLGLERAKYLRTDMPTSLPTVISRSQGNVTGEATAKFDRD